MEDNKEAMISKEEMEQYLKDKEESHRQYLEAQQQLAPTSHTVKALYADETGEIIEEKVYEDVMALDIREGFFWLSFQDGTSIMTPVITKDKHLAEVCSEMNKDV